MIEFKNVSKVYPGGFTALKDVNLTIHEGEFIAIIGRSGAGKSTLIRTINKMIDINEEILKKLENEPKTGFKTAVNIIIIVGLLVWSFLGIQPSESNINGWGIVGNIFSGIFSPDWSLFNLTEQGIPFLLVETLAIGLLGTLMGAILAIPFSFLQASNIVPKWIAYITRLFLILVRTIPTLVYGLIFIRVVGPGAFAGILTMAMTSIGMLAKLFTE